MREFVVAALSLVLAGAAVAIICAGMDKKGSTEKEKKMEQYIAAGAGLGILGALALDLCGLWSNAFVFAVCPLWGMAFATMLGSRNDKKAEEKGEDK